MLDLSLWNPMTEAKFRGDVCILNVDERYLLV
jgi:hypothetical protein